MFSGFRNLTVGLYLAGLLAFGTFYVQAQPGVPVILVQTNAVWKYLDDGSDQGLDWTSPFDYDDGLWAQGPAELGYGDAVDGRPEATVVSYGSDPAHKHITTYFRYGFWLTNIDSITNVTARLLRDDGAVAYLNGQEIFRNNMPLNSDYSTTAS